MDAIIHAIKEALQNQLLSGGLILMMTGSLIALCRKAPIQAWGWLKRQALVSVDVTSDDPIFEWLSVWLAVNPYSLRARNLTAAVRRNEYGNIDFEKPTVIFTPAPGQHFFVYQRKLVWLSRDRKDAAPSGSGPDASLFSRIKRETFNIRMLGRKQSVIRALIEEARLLSITEKDERVDVFISGRNYWIKTDTRQPRAISSVVLPINTVNQMVGDIKEFLEKREWYQQIGIPYRRGFLFYGIPGSGKSSLISALSGEFKMNLYALNLGDSLLSDGGLCDLLAGVPARSMVLLEDIDAVFSQREKKTESDVTFSGLLNALDGVAAKEGSLVFMTTNHVDRLDEALIRSGRVDVRVEFGHATREQIAELYLRFFPGEKLSNADLFAEEFSHRRVSMADVQQHLLKHKDSPARAVHSLRLVKDVAA
jgi:chaperone BCS1